MIVDDKGKIWIPQVWQGNFPLLAVLDPVKETYKKLERKTGISGTFTWSVYQADKNNIWLATNDGFDIIHSDKGKISHIKKSAGLANDTTRIITGDGNGHFWVGYKNGQVDMLILQKVLSQNMLTCVVQKRTMYFSIVSCLEKMELYG